MQKIWKRLGNYRPAYSSANVLAKKARHSLIRDGNPFTCGLLLIIWDTVKAPVVRWSSSGLLISITPWVSAGSVRFISYGMCKSSRLSRINRILNTARPTLCCVLSECCVQCTRIAPYQVYLSEALKALARMQYTGPKYKVLFHQTCVIGEGGRGVKIFTRSSNSRPELFPSRRSWETGVRKLFGGPAVIVVDT